MGAERKVLRPWLSQTFLEDLFPKENRMLDPLPYLTYHEPAGCSAGVARLVWDQEVGGSNPPTPTMIPLVRVLVKLPVSL